MDYMDIDARWKAIGELVEIYGNNEEKLAWAMCRGDYAELRLQPCICGGTTND